VEALAVLNWHYVQSHLHQVLRRQQEQNNLEIHLFHGDAELMPNYSWMRFSFRKF